ncbi:sporulation membrane protein YtaF [Nodosilinea sp. P-1105]|uniref:sporulation membrane protein YtaF n=1 Tax=Nodosilinea sp. P-1105 TaxID=2546229 RepID=UPI00146CDBEB
MNFFSLLPLAVAVSLDSFGVGVAYGVRRIHVPFWSLAMITLCTALTLLLSVFTGEVIVTLISPEAPEALGGGLLVGIGLLAVLNQIKSQMPPREKPYAPDLSPQADQGSPDHSDFNPLKIIPRILASPDAADFDQSHTISLHEAFFLGLAVSLDSFVAGIGIRLLGYSPWLIILTMALMSSAFIYVGIRLGMMIAGHRWFRQLPYFPGTLLIVIGLHRLF